MTKIWINSEIWCGNDFIITALKENIYYWSIQILIWLLLCVFKMWGSVQRSSAAKTGTVKRAAATTNKSIQLETAHACVGEDDVNLRKTWRENYSIVPSSKKRKTQNQKMWSAVKLERKQICCIFRWWTMIVFVLTRVDTSLRSLLCLSSCSIIHSLVRLFCHTPSPAVSQAVFVFPWACSNPVCLI